MLFLAAIAVVPAAPPATPARATATVRIERPVAVRAAEWNDIPRELRRELTIAGEDGRAVLLRVVEMP